MNDMTNSDVVKLLNKTLDPLMKNEGFRRNGRKYYKKCGDIIFVLETKAVGGYFSFVTNWPSHAFSVLDGVWVDGINPGYYGAYPKKIDKDGIYIPEAHTCFHVTGDNYGIYRREEHPYLETSIQYGVELEAEQKRRDIWVMPYDSTEQTLFLKELTEQVRKVFLDCYLKYTDKKQLHKLILDDRKAYNLDRGYKEGMDFCKDSFVGNFKGYLKYAVLFYQRYGDNEQYTYYLRRLEEWSKVHEENVSPCYYCGVGNEFKL